MRTVGPARGTRLAVHVAGGQATGGAATRLCARLSADGFVVKELPDLEVDAADVSGVDAFLLICGSPRAAGGRADAVAAVRGLRARAVAAPVLVIGEVTAAAYVAGVLDAGADEYIRQPYDPVEVAARVRALVRRSSGLLRLGPGRDAPVLDRCRHVVAEGGAEVPLTPREAALLECLVQRAGRPVTRDELATCVWGAETFGRAPTNIVDVYVAYLRRKLGALGRASMIRSVRGIGYELAVEPRPVTRGDEPERGEDDITVPTAVRGAPSPAIAPPPPRGHAVRK